MWLISEQVPDYDVFSWAANCKGVDRATVNGLLKEAAIKAGIPGADVSSHSLRRTGLCRLMSAKPTPMTSAGTTRNSCQPVSDPHSLPVAQAKADRSEGLFENDICVDVFVPFDFILCVRWWGRWIKKLW